MSYRLTRFSVVDEVDQGGMPDGEWFVYLMPGWAFDDAVDNPADDPNGESPQHVRGGEVDYLVERLRNVQPCSCGYCVRRLADEYPDELTADELAWLQANPEPLEAVL